MCARISIRKGQFKVGDKIPVNTGLELKWQGFAMQETLEKTWHPAVWKPVTVTVDDFAERHHGTGHLVWAYRPANIKFVTNGLVVNLVTRQASAAEKAYFGHHRVPVEIE